MFMIVVYVTPEILVTRYWQGLDNNGIREEGIYLYDILNYVIYFKVHEDYVHECRVCHPGDPRRTSPATLDDNIITEEGEEEEKEEDEEALRYC